MDHRYQLVGSEAVNLVLMQFTLNLTGTPAISIPCGFDGKGLPIGLQIQGNAFAEAQILNVAHRYQQTTDWHRRIPAAFAP